MCQIVDVDYERAALLPAPRTNRPNRRETFVPVLFSCGNEVMVRKSHVNRVTMCSHCQHSEAGKKGYQSTTERYGMSMGLYFQARYQLTNCSQPEQIVKDWLHAARIHVKCQYIFSQDNRFGYVIDFVIGLRAVEVRGYWHREKKAQKDAELVQRWPGDVLFIDDTDILTRPEEVRQELLAFVLQ